MKYERGVVYATPIDWLFLAKLHHKSACKQKTEQAAHKYKRWSWMALFMWAAGEP